MPFDFLGKVTGLTASELTIREQARLAQNPNEMRWRAIFPRTDARDLDISQLTKVDTRFAAEFREFNADGREIPEVLGPKVQAKLVPMTATHHIDEERLARLRAPNPRLAQLVEDGVIGDVRTWPTRLSNAVDWGTEYTAFQMWALNQITVKDPKTGSSTTVSRGVDSSRYITESTAWNDGSVNAYDRLLFRIGEAQRLMGSVGAVRMRRATAEAVRADAPNGPNALRPTIVNIQDRLSEEGFGAITLIIDERTVNVFDDGGSAYTATNLIPAEKVLFQPADGVVGATYDFPATRAYDYVSGDHRVNLNDTIVWYTPQNNGKTLLIEAEAIRLPLTDEQRTYVVDAGV